MFITVSYDELSRLVKEKSGQTLGFRYKDADTVTLIYDATLNLPVLSKPVSHSLSIDMQVVELVSPQAVLQFDAGPAGNMALDFAVRNLLPRLPQGLVERFYAGRAVLHLDAVPQLQSFFNRLTVNRLSFHDQYLRIDASI